MEMNTIADWWKWVELAREDPEQFEKERAAAIEKLISSQPARCRQQNRRLQWKIDAIRQTSPNSIYACVRIYDLLMDSVYGTNGLLESFKLLVGRNRAIGQPVVPRKKVVYYPDFNNKKG